MLDLALREDAEVVTDTRSGLSLVRAAFEEEEKA
jgi:hypothetical protein